MVIQHNKGPRILEKSTDTSISNHPRSILRASSFSDATPKTKSIFKRSPPQMPLEKPIKNTERSVSFSEVEPLVKIIPDNASLPKLPLLESTIYKHLTTVKSHCKKIMGPTTSPARTNTFLRHLAASLTTEIHSLLVDYCQQNLKTTQKPNQALIHTNVKSRLTDITEKLARNYNGTQPIRGMLLKNKKSFLLEHKDHDRAAKLFAKDLEITLPRFTLLLTKTICHEYAPQDPEYSTKVLKKARHKAKESVNWTYEAHRLNQRAQFSPADILRWLR